MAHSDEEINRIRSVFAIYGKENKGVKVRRGDVLNAVTVFEDDNSISFSIEMAAGKGQVNAWVIEHPMKYSRS